MNNFINAKRVSELGYSLETFVNLPKYCQKKLMLSYIRDDIVSLSKEELDFIFKKKIDGIIDREHRKKELIKRLIN